MSKLLYYQCLTDLSNRLKVTIKPACSDPAPKPRSRSRLRAGSEPATSRFRDLGAGAGSEPATNRLRAGSET